MRRIVVEQPPLVPVLSDHPHAHELEAMAAILDAMPEAARLVHRDLTKGKSSKVGRDGMTAEAVLRAGIAKQMNTWSYRELEFHVSDSMLYRWFLRLGFKDDPPSLSTLKRNLKRVRDETWEAINRLLIDRASAEKIETGKVVRTDCTVVESNIHAPTDSSLLWDVVRVLVRLTKAAGELVQVPFKDHSRRAKRRFIGILNAKRFADRKPLYADLLAVTDKTMSYALAAARALDEDFRPRSIGEAMKASSLAGEIRHFASLGARVADQTRRRVLEGESVPANEKLVSIFETHTDIIVKDRRETLYGHKIALTTGRSGLVLDCVVLEGNPADSTLATRMVERQVEVYGQAPKQVSFDGAFASKANLESIKELGVGDVCFSKKRFLDLADMVKSTWVYRKLRRFRAGIEAGVSFLKRCFGLGRCMWKGFASFKAYTWASVVAHNLLVLARRSTPA